jgi:hypothetical protein
LGSKLKAAAEPNPDRKDDDCEPDVELISIPVVSKVQCSEFLVFSSHPLELSKYRDPLHVILEYIAEVRAMGTRLHLSLHIWY